MYIFAAFEFIKKHQAFVFGFSAELAHLNGGETESDRYATGPAQNAWLVLRHLSSVG
ncbi:protein of unknown function [Methylocaldum szegediense]|uniref:Uncharacterized protein n=1 Tax=Methylocaldum szegediense TaxID=73780 RepID=A0ABM9I1Q5_9GAMM|nr:protein of unknown function [Methylocaldum szegediense]